MNLAEAFARAATNDLNKPAVFWGDEQYSYGQLWAQTTWVGERLKVLGVKPGATIGLWLKNCPQFIPSLFGVWEADGVVAPINNFLKPDEVAYILSDAGIKLVITDESMAEACEKLKALLPDTVFLKIEEITSSSENPIGVDMSNAPAVPAASGSARTESDLAVIIYTSGTTGRPKGAMLTHGNLLHNVNSCRQVLKAVGDDRFVVVLPMFHSFMLTVGILLPFCVGGSIVLIKSLHPPKNIIEEVVKRQATILPAVPQFFRTLMHPSVPPQIPLRLCISGGAPLPGEILKEFTAKFPFPLVEGYGLSEASPVVTFNPLEKQKPGSIGKPIAGVEVTVQDDAGALLGAGETGEICVRGGNVMQGYWNKPEETEKSIRDGWLLTGDVGHQDEEGYFYITDRKKDMLLVNGINVYPREIEERIYQFPGVKEAAVIGVPDARRGELPIAFVSMNEGTTLDEKALLQFLREKLADYKIPKRVTALPALPRNATGKILKTSLRQMVQEAGA
ncbi:MAG: long-chain fatty acid--CoA ligase [Verrucomicrobia bacterium]|nr:long-chain fatty acid--CoA ligase [Verrucomicrobiota bacterium]